MRGREGEGESGRKKIEENHTEAQMIDGMLTLYKQVYEAD